MRFQGLNETSKKDGDSPFSRACSDRARANASKIKIIDLEEILFIMSMMKHWHDLPRDVADAPSQGEPKVRFDKALSNLIEYVPVHCKWVGLDDL